jgi:hypothetical protein
MTGAGSAESSDSPRDAGAYAAPPHDTRETSITGTADPTVRGRPTIRGRWEDCPRLIRDEEVERAPSRFGGLRYRTRSDPGREWVGEIAWRARCIRGSPGRP